MTCLTGYITQLYTRYNYMFLLKYIVSTHHYCNVFINCGMSTFYNDSLFCVACIVWKVFRDSFLCRLYSMAATKGLLFFVRRPSVCNTFWLHHTFWSHCQITLFYSKDYTETSDKCLYECVWWLHKKGIIQ